ncbi:MAG: FAD-binding oxidoreductase [Kiritimatiellia bacterium]|jgi:D-lactate dehydrogenase (cytochrome)|nr:FAD-binding oxidoreductase [Kiritimatiellia bacterium]
MIGAMSHTPRLTRPVPAEYLRDESRKTGAAEAIAFPRDRSELTALLRAAEPAGLPVTPQGARTGIAAGAVPDGGLVVNLSRMDRILACCRENPDRTLLRVEPGLPLVLLQRHLADRRLFPEPLFFPPDPTEPSASLGGMAACNASGARSFAYGATRRHIEAVTAVLADGDTVTLRRGREQAAGRRFAITTAGGRRLEGDLPLLPVPAVKNAAGYAIRPGMDLIDLLLGSEGTLAILAELELRLAPAPADILGIVAFFGGEEQALTLVERIRPCGAAARSPLLTAIEYFDEGALRLAREGAARTGVPLPPVPARGRNAVYLEWALDDGPDAALDQTARLVADAGGNPADTWVAREAVALGRLKAFRHAAPEQVNALIAERALAYPGLTKLGTDFSVPDVKLRPLLRRYREDLAAANLEHVIFGHIGDNHLHVNILPRDRIEYETGKRLYRSWAAQVVSWGGSISAEHGVGRLKRELLREMVGAEGLEGMRRIKRLFDPTGRLNPGCLFEAHFPSPLRVKTC